MAYKDDATYKRIIELLKAVCPFTPQEQTLLAATIWILMKKSHSVVDPDYMTFVSRSGSVDLVEWSYGNIRVLIQGKKLDFDPAKSTRDYHNAAFAGFRAAIDEKMRHIY